MSTKPGATILPVASMVSAASPSSGWATWPTAPNLDDLAVLDGDVGVVSVRAGSVDDGSTGDFQVEHDYSLGCAAGWLQWNSSRECNTVTEASGVLP